jgi:hypothetical protein
MAQLKEKAKARADKKNSGKLASKAKSRPKSNAKAQTIDEIEREEGVGGATAPVTSGSYVPQRPPLPPALTWLRKRATIPALRQGGQG